MSQSEYPETNPWNWMKLAAVTLEVFVEQNMNHKFLGTPLSASLPQGNPEVWIKRLDSIFKSKIATCSFLQLLLPRNTQLLPRGYRNMYVDMDYMGEKSLVCYISYCIMVVLLFLCSLNSKMFQQLLLSLVTVIKNSGLGIRIAGTWVPFPCMSGNGTSQNSDIHFLQCVCLLPGGRKWFFARLSCAGDRERSLWRDMYHTLHGSPPHKHTKDPDVKVHTFVTDTELCIISKWFFLYFQLFSP